MIGQRPQGRTLRWMASAVIAAVALTLAGCSGGTPGDELVCPAAQVAPDLGSIAIFKPGNDRSANGVQVAGKISGVTRVCENDKMNIVVNMAIGITAGRTQPDVKSIDFPYFVAIADFNQTILNEQRFTVNIPFPGGSDFRAVQEKITVRIPVQRLSAGRNFGVVVGFQLLPEQLQFNRGARGNDQ